MRSDPIQLAGKFLHHWSPPVEARDGHRPAGSLRAMIVISFRLIDGQSWKVFERRDNDDKSRRVAFAILLP